MAHSEVEPFLQLEGNQVSDIRTKKSPFCQHYQFTMTLTRFNLDLMSFILQPRASGASESEDAEGGTTVFGNVRCFCFYSLLESLRNPLKSAEEPSGNGCRKLGGSFHLEEQPSGPENAWIQGLNHMSSMGFS